MNRTVRVHTGNKTTACDCGTIIHPGIFGRGRYVGYIPKSPCADCAKDVLYLLTISRIKWKIVRLRGEWSRARTAVRMCSIACKNVLRKHVVRRIGVAGRRKRVG